MIAGLEGRDHGTAAGDDPAGELAMAGRKEMVVAAAEHADRRRARGQRTLVGGTVDPEGEAGDDADAAAGKLGRQLPGAAPSVVRGDAGPDHGDAGRAQAVELAGDPQAGQERLGEPVAADLVELGAAGPAPLPKVLEGVKGMHDRPSRRPDRRQEAESLQGFVLPPP